MYEFYKGQQVEFTDEAIESFFNSKRKTPSIGIISSKPRVNSPFVIVLRDGQKKSETWHRKFWKPMG